MITGLAVGEVVSVQSGESFAYALTAPSGTPAPTPTPTASGYSSRFRLVRRPADR